MQQLLEYLLKLVPLFIALGLFHAAASGLRALWAKAKAAADTTPTKVDDVLVHLIDPHMETVIALLDRGDVAGATKKINAVRALIPRK